VSAQPKWCGPFQYSQETCPACGSADVSFGGTSTTLVGWMSGRPEDNPNHHTQGCVCRACGLHYTREWVIRDRNAWAAIGVDEGEVIYGSKAYTKYVIAGYPSCCDAGYLIHCRCGAWAKNRQHHQTVSSRNVDGVWVTTPENIWECPSCGYSGKEMPQEEPKPIPTAFERLLQDDG